VRKRALDKTGAVREGWLRAIEQKDNVFPKIDHRIYRFDHEPSLAAESGEEGT
jgi:hypothetical protein